MVLKQGRGKRTVCREDNVIEIKIIEPDRYFSLIHAIA